MFSKNVKIKIIGDSLAAGAGSSLFYETDEIILEDGGNKYFRCVSPNGWWGLLEKCLEQIGKHCVIQNNGCCGAFSYQINEHLEKLVTKDDQVVLILMGLNDRKRIDGMKELQFHLEETIKKLSDLGKGIVLLTPTPSVYSNEYYPNRIYHTDEVVAIIRDVAAKTVVKLIDNYKFVNEYLEKQGLKIDDIIYGDGCKNDGLHPGDFVQKLIFENIRAELQI